jgi:hypothetical protein
VERLVVSQELFDLDFELAFLERVGGVKLASDECVEERSCSAVYLWADASELALYDAVEAILLYLGGVIVVLPRA